MRDPSESAVDRGIADAREWFGRLSFRVAAIIVPGVVLSIAYLNQVSGLMTIVMSVVSGLAFIALVVLIAILTAPIRQRDDLRERNQELQHSIDSRRDGLAELLSEGVKLLRELPESYDDWLVRMYVWTEHTRSYVLLNFGKADERLFEDTGPVTAKDFPGSLPGKHNFNRNTLHTRVEVLRNILNRPR